MVVGGIGIDLSCVNVFVDLLCMLCGLGFIYDVFDDFVVQICVVYSEVFVVNMQWDFGLGLFGSMVVVGVVDLYVCVKVDLVVYFQGMVVCFLFGGYFDFVCMVDGVMQVFLFVCDLWLCGVLLDDLVFGWCVSILNYLYFLYSYVKLYVIDGQDLMVGSYNMSWIQLFCVEGGNLQYDMGLYLCGLVVQVGVVVFDDLWWYLQQFYCLLEVLLVEVFDCCFLGQVELLSYLFVVWLVFLVG